MNSDANFDDLIDLAVDQTMIGWDFSWLNERTDEEALPWDYRQRVRERLRGWTDLLGGAHVVEALLDVGTGGGELLSQLGPFPPVTWATEGYVPNVSVARERLEPLGIHVLDVSAGEAPPLAGLSDGMFDLVIDRHNGLPGAELARLLRPGGRYLTQQVGGQNCLEFNRVLQERVFYEYSECSLPNLVNDLQGAGLVVVEAREAFPVWRFHDIAGVVFYLLAVPWQVPGFHVNAYREALYGIHQQIERDGSFPVTEHRILIEVEKMGETIFQARIKKTSAGTARG